MRLPPFDLHEPRTVDEAVDLLGRGDGETRLLAGGTALVPMLRLGLVRPERIVSLDRVPGLAELRAAGGALEVGAMVTLGRLAGDPRVARGWPVLAAATAAVATPGIRSTATVGGNLGYAEAASDPAPALLCVEAEILTAGPGGRRAVPVTDFYTGFYSTALRAGEIVTGLRLPPLPGGARSGYTKFRSRSAEDKPLVGVAGVLALDAGGRCETVRVGLAGVAPTAIRARGAEAALRGRVPDAAAIQAAADAAAVGCDPLSDLMGSADYRREMVRVWVRRLLTDLRDGRPAPHPA